jgi:lactate dehydrogenase-like 2-hydroxyacid dehydrogenase
VSRDRAEAPRILLTRRLPEAVEDRLSSRFDVAINEADVPLSRDALVAAMRDFDVLCPTITDSIDAALIRTPGRRVRLIANFGAGTEHIDLQAARDQAVVVTNTPDALTASTAELTLTLMLMAARRAGEGEREARSGRWTGWRPTHMLGQTLHGKTLGLIGFGRIARAVARLADAFGMTVLYYRRTPVEAEEQAGLAARRSVSLAELAAQSDVLSVHVPGGEATYHLVDGALLQRMKPTAILINTARGPVVEEEALIKALSEGRIAGAALDVYEHEPAIPPPLRKLENVVILPHLGSATVETREAMGMQMADNVECFLDGRPVPNAV